MGRLVEMGDLLVHAINCQRVLNQIVGPDTEKIYLAGQHVSRYGGAWDLDHRADLDFVGDVDLCLTQLFFALRQHFDGAT